MVTNTPANGTGGIVYKFVGRSGAGDACAAAIAAGGLACTRSPAAIAGGNCILPHASRPARLEHL